MPRKSGQLVAERVPPQNLEAEKALLGCMLQEEDALNQVLEAVTADFFYSKAHQQIFSAIVKLFDQNKKCDLIVLTNQLQNEGLLDGVGGAVYLAELADAVPSAALVDEYVKIVKDKHILRSLIANATTVISEASAEPDEVEALLDRAESLIFEVSEHRVEKEAHQLKDLVHDTLELFERIHSGETALSGFPTGFIDLDKQISGLQPSDLIIVASRPSMGKTALACNMAMNMAVGSKDFPILIFSLEMSKEQLVQRMLCCEARINSAHLRQGFLSSENMGRLMQAAGRLAETRIFIDDSASLNVFEVRARARRLKAREHVKLVIVDYLQLMRGRGRSENRQQEISEISAALKALAKELAIPVVAVSQLSRAAEQREDKRPQLSDLRESGSIEQDADLVMFLYRDEYYFPDNSEAKGKAEVIIAKQRNGPTGTVNLSFLRELTRFENYTFRQ